MSYVRLSPNRGVWSVKLAIMGRGKDLTNNEKTTVHTLMKKNWNYEQNQFKHEGRSLTLKECVMYGVRLSVWYHRKNLSVAKRNPVQNTARWRPPSYRQWWDLLVSCQVHDVAFESLQLLERRNRLLISCSRVAFDKCYGGQITKKYFTSMRDLYWDTLTDAEKRARRRKTDTVFYSASSYGRTQVDIGKGAIELLDGDLKEGNHCEKFTLDIEKVINTMLKVDHLLYV